MYEFNSYLDFRQTKVMEGDKKMEKRRYVESYN